MDRNLVDKELGWFVRMHDHRPAGKTDDLTSIQCNDQFVDPGRKKGPCPRGINLIIESTGSNAIKNMRVLWTEIANGDWVLRHN